MPFSTSNYDAHFGPDVHGDDQKRLLTYLTGAGTPTATSTVPSFVGQFYLDTSAAHFYMATVLSSTPAVGDFKLVTI